MEKKKREEKKGKTKGRGAEYGYRIELANFDLIV